MDRRAHARELMLAFTGRGRRYLWTDAYAVCNWLGLGDRERALRLVDAVHQTLGRHGGRWLDDASEGTRPAEGCASGSRCRSARPASASTSGWSGIETASTSTILRAG